MRKLICLDPLQSWFWKHFLSSYSVFSQMASPVNPHSHPRLRLHRNTHTERLVCPQIRLLLDVCLFADDNADSDELQVQLKLLNRSWNYKLEERGGLKYFYHKATERRRWSEAEGWERTDGGRERMRAEDRTGWGAETVCPSCLPGAGCPRPAAHPAWSGHHGLSGKLPGDWPRHVEPLHPHRQLRYLAPSFPDILYHVWLPGQRSHQGVRSGPAAHSVSHQAGGDAELLGTDGAVGHGQHDHHLPRTIKLGLQGEEEHDGLKDAALINSVHT